MQINRCNQTFRPSEAIYFPSANPPVYSGESFDEPRGMSLWGSNPPVYSEKSFNEPRGIRTPDNLIKSQVLYRLS